MEISQVKKLQRSIRNLILLFISGMMIVGISTFPLTAEVTWLSNWLVKHFGTTSLTLWVTAVSDVLNENDLKYPFMAYGTDWLAFAHIVIALAFIGPLRDPVKNKWVIEWGMITSLLVIPLALIAGPLRQIPFFHQLIDCSFGVVGFALLYFCHKKIVQLEKSTIHV